MARGAPPETVREWADGTDGRCAIKSPRGRTGKAVVLVAGGRARGHRYVAMVLNPGLYSAHKRSTTLVGAKRRQLLMQPSGCDRDWRTVDLDRPLDGLARAPERQRLIP